MTIDRLATRWNGWGWTSTADPLKHGDAVWTAIEDALGGGPLPVTPSVGLESVVIPPTRLTDAARAELPGIVGAEGYRDDHESRVRCSVGSSYRDLLQLRRGALESPPVDGVIVVHEEEQVVPVLAWAARHAVAVIPRGGGTSVVGGVTSAVGGWQAAVALDLTRLSRLLDVDDTSLLATAQAGIDGPALETSLGPLGLTIGHAPQSFEFSTLGGWIAARGAGQQSGRYGKAEDWFAGGSLATPQGTWSIPAFPASSTGPDLRALVAGSEGALGVLTRAIVRVQRRPEKSAYRAWLFPTFEHGADSVRQLLQREVALATVRLSDADEVFLLRALQAGAHSASVASRVRRRALSALGVPERPCLLILGMEGTAHAVDASRRLARRLCRSSGGVYAGEAPAHRWYQGRFHGPYLRDPLLDRGLGVDTLETATQWSNVVSLHGAISSALRTAIERHTTARGVVMGHLSHAYRDGASLYFTYLFRRDDSRALQQWSDIKSDVTNAIVTSGGTLSHHHGIGRDHAPWLSAEKGELGVAVLRAIKRTVDPTGILNPGVLFSE